MRRTKKDRLPGGADEQDRAKFAKLRDYLLRVEDEVTCTSCGKRFEIPSQQSLVFVDQFAGLPNDEELEREIAAASGEPEPAPESEARDPRPFPAEVHRLEVSDHGGRDAEHTDLTGDVTGRGLRGLPNLHGTRIARI